MFFVCSKLPYDIDSIFQMIQTAGLVQKGEE